MGSKWNLQQYYFIITAQLSLPQPISAIGGDAGVARLTNRSNRLVTVVSVRGETLLCARTFVNGWLERWERGNGAGKEFAGRIKSTCVFLLGLMRERKWAHYLNSRYKSRLVGKRFRRPRFWLRRFSTLCGLPYTLFQNGRHFSILLFPCKLALTASLSKVKFKGIFNFERGHKGQFAWKQKNTKIVAILE